MDETGFHIFLFVETFSFFSKYNIFENTIGAAKALQLPLLRGRCKQILIHGCRRFTFLEYAVNSRCFQLLFLVRFLQGQRHSVRQ